MAAYQYVYHMDNLAKTYPGGKQVFSGISLHFLPDAKIGVVGVNGAGKSSLLRIMAGQDTDFTGEAWAEKGVRVGYLPRSPSSTRPRPFGKTSSKGLRTSRSMTPTTPSPCSSPRIIPTS